VEADVLVNLITCKTSNLAKAGAVSSSLLDVAGSQLQRVSTLNFFLFRVTSRPSHVCSAHAFGSWVEIWSFSDYCILSQAFILSFRNVTFIVTLLEEVSYTLTAKMAVLVNLQTCRIHTFYNAHYNAYIYDSCIIKMLSINFEKQSQYL